jgi:outer membrane protein assembly factor BamB
MHAQETAAGLPLFPLRVRWSTAFGAPPAAGPVADAARVYVPLTSGAIVAVDADTGAAVWTAEGLASTLPLAVDTNSVYVVVEAGLVALDARTGGERWRLPLDERLSAPLVARAGWIVLGLAGGDVLAVRAADGSPVWTRSYPTPLVSPAVIHGDRVYLPGADARVRSARIEDGTVVWEQSVGGAVLTISPLDNRVYVGADDNFFYALDERQGRRLWRWRTGGDLIGQASADDRRVFFTSLDTVLRALDRGHGAQLWRRPLPWRPRSGPVLLGTTALVAGVALDLRGFATETGSPVGEFTLSPDRLEVLEGVPVVVPRDRLPGAYVVVALADGRLLALEHAFGLKVEPLTRLPGETMALTSPLPTTP